MTATHNQYPEAPYRIPPKAESRLSKNDTRSGIPAQVYPGGYTRSGTLLLVCSGQTVLDRVHVRSVERDYRLHLVLQEVRL